MQMEGTLAGNPESNGDEGQGSDLKNIAKDCSFPNDSCPTDVAKYSNLPRPDGGWKAWRFICVAFMVDAMVWGPPLCFGVFLPFAPYSQMDSSLAGLIGTISLALLYCGGIVVSPLAQRYPRFCVWSPTIGTALCGGGLLGASQFNKGWEILLTQGVAYGLGGAMIYSPALIYLSEWWVARRGMAGGVMFSGSALLGIFFAPIMDRFLRKYGTEFCLRWFAVMWLGFMVPTLPFLVGRLPRGKGNVGHNFDPAVLKLPLLWFLILLNCFQSLVFYVPSLYMPLYEKSLGGSGALALELYSAASIASQVLGGLASDYIDVSYLTGASCLGSALCVFLLWGLCNSLAMFSAFSILYGLMGPILGSLWQRFAMVIAPSEPNSGVLVSMFFASRGIVSFLTGPICGKLLKNRQSNKEDFYPIIYFTGAFMLLSSFGVTMRFLYKPCGAQNCKFVSA